VSRAKHQQALDMLPLLAGLFVACIAAASVIGATVHAPLYELTLYSTITVGLLCSFLTVRGKANLSFLGSLVIIAAFTGFVVRRVGVFPGNLLYPPEVVVEPDTALAALIAWMMAGFCFIHSQREHTILCLVSGLAILGLMGTVNLNTSTIISFCVYLLAAIYTFAYDNLLATHRIREASGRVPWTRRGGNQLIPAAVLFLAVALMAIGAGRIMYQVSPNLYDEASRIRWNWPHLNTTGHNDPNRGFWVGGGPTHLTEQVVMTVRSDMPALWRGYVYDWYEGQSWLVQNRITTQLRAADGGRYQISDPRLLVDAQLEQVFHLEKISSGIIFAAAQPAEVGPIETAGGIRPMVQLISQRSGIIQVAPPMPVGSSYRVVSKATNYSPQQLRAAGTHYPGQEWTLIYIDQVPLAVEERLSDLVAQVTAGAETPYDKVTQILEFLEDNYLYTEGPPLTPRHRDSAVYFLLTSKRGDCGLFATAMTMMCRLAGVPARLATGFATGEYDAERDLYLVRGEHAHAWVEVYFPGCGWVPFDPQAIAQPERQSLVALLRSGHFRLVVSKIVRVSSYTLGALALVALLASMFVNFNLLSAWWQAWRTRRLPWHRLDHEWRRFYRKALRQHSVRPGPQQTPNELLELVLAGKLIPIHLSGPLRRATHDLYELRYSARPAPDSQIDKLRTRWAHLRRRI